MKEIAKRRQTRPIIPSEMGIKPHMETIQLKDQYISGRFKTRAEFEILNQGKILDQPYIHQLNAYHKRPDRGWQKVSRCTNTGQKHKGAQCQHC